MNKAVDNRKNAVKGLENATAKKFNTVEEAKAHLKVIDQHQKSVELYDGKVKKNLNSMYHLENGSMSPGKKDLRYIEKKEAAIGNIRLTPRPRTKGDYDYHRQRYGNAETNKNNAVQVFEEAKKKKVSTIEEAKAHAERLDQQEETIKQYDGKMKKNLSSMYHLQERTKKPGPKNLQYIKDKENRNRNRNA
ncbi:hypothetical protein L7F22_039028 [Adiantum nelumboides]|nr:hypothetical protein [Adiantum nelumboides]